MVVTWEEEGRGDRLKRIVRRGERKMDPDERAAVTRRPMGAMV